MKRTFLVGAGFSRAVSDAMPLMADLGPVARAALADLPLPSARPRPEDDIEAWLSFAREPQPFLTPEANLLNRAAAERVTAAIRIRVLEGQRALEDGAVPDWLDDLVTAWHGQRADVITLNWDAVVEVTVRALRLWSLTNDLGSWTTSLVSSDDLLGGVPRLAPGSPSTGNSRTTFRLWKLHGSIDWYWSEGDTHGETVVRRPWDRGPTVGDYVGIVTKSPFFAAPTATKSGYYDNQVLRFVWRRARTALEQTDELVVIGYSVPHSDLSVRALLAGTSATRVLVVDPRPGPVAERIRALLDPSVEIETIDSPRNAAARMADDQVRHAATQIEAWTDQREVPVLLALSDGRYAPLYDAAASDDGMLILTSDEWSDSVDTATAASERAALTAADLLERLPSGGAVRVLDPDGHARLPYAATVLGRPTGRSHRWMQIRAQH